ncbi:MAG TPA: TIGR03032 family protein [Conexibacter sp.]
METTERIEPEIAISDGFEGWLAEQRTSLVFATPPAKLFLVGLDADGALSVFERTFDKCMGLAQVDTQTLYLGTRHHLWRLENDLRPGELTEAGYDRRFIPRHCSATGYLNTHDLAVEDDGRVLFVNTRFGCLAEPRDDASFAPVWWPSFLPGPQPNDRCHLNGVAVRDGRARYATAVGQATDVDGWRRHRRDGGLVIDIATDEIVACGLSMPHSPRWYRDRLWLANAGTGELGTIDLASGRFEPVAFVPGFARGLCFVGDYAVVGTSRPRHGDLYAGLPLDERLLQAGEPACLGLFAIDLRDGAIAAWLTIDGPVRELFEVIALPGVRRPQALGLVGGEIAEAIRFDALEGVL